MTRPISHPKAGSIAAEAPRQRDERIARNAADTKEGISQHGGSRFEQALFWLFVLALTWTPLLYGSNTLLAWGVNAVIFPSLVLAYELWVLLTRRRHAVGIGDLLIPASLFAAVVLWTVLQIVSAVPTTLQHPIWTMASEALEQPLDGSISVNRDATVLALIRLVTAASVFWLSLQLSRNAEQAYRLLRAIVGIIAVYATYGLVLLAFSHEYVTSTFFNRNSFAAYGGIGVVVACGLLLRVYRHEVGMVANTGGLRLAAFIETTGQKAALLLISAFVILVATLLTGSRGGLISCALGLFVFTILIFRRSRKGSSDQRDAIIFGAVVVMAVFLVFGDSVVGRISQLGMADNARVAVYRITLGSILDAPFVGYGYGTFSDIFPMFRDRSVDRLGTWEMAHNTYLEVFEGLGLLFGSMLLVSVGMLVAKCLKGAMVRQESVTVPSVATGVAFLLGINAVVDFSLQIQAICLLFMAILGAGVAQSTSTRRVVSD